MSDEHSTWMGKPFISYDGEDQQGVRAEVMVYRGLANVHTIEDKQEGGSVKFSFLADNIKYPVGAWVNKSRDEKIYEALKETHDNDGEIYVRIEKKRKPKVDRESKMEEIAPHRDMAKSSENSIRIIAGIRHDEDEEWVESSESVTLASEDEQYMGGSTGSVKATAANTQNKARQNSSVNPFSDSVEAPPYKTFNFDNSVNPGSGAVGAVANIYNFVNEYFIKHPELSLPDDERKAQTIKIELTTKLLDVCNRAQVAVYNGRLETPQMSLNSHTRARAYVFQNTESDMPITQEHVDDMDAFNEHCDKLYEKVVRMWKWAMKLAQDIEDD